MSAGPRLARREALIGGLVLLAPLSGCSRTMRFTCTNEEGLTEDERAMRRNLAYVDQTTQPGKTCDVCTQWIPAPESGKCGGCKIMKGPIHPAGYCKVFAQQS